jgi:uncharacterized membrane protein
MLFSWKGFCEDIGNLIFGINMNEFDISFFNMITNEMMSNFNMLEWKTGFLEIWMALVLSHIIGTLRKRKS